MGVYAVQILRKIPRQQGACGTRGKLVTVIRQVFGGQNDGGIRKELCKRDFFRNAVSFRCGEFQQRVITSGQAVNTVRGVGGNP